jgi:hypothetical protein
VKCTPAASDSQGPLVVLPYVHRGERRDGHDSFGTSTFK